MKKLNHYEVLSNMLLLLASGYIGVTGIFLILTPVPELFNQSRTFIVLSEYMGLNIWGLLFVLCGFLYLIASLVQWRPAYICMLLAGVIGFTGMAAYMMVSVEVGVNILTPIRYGIIASMNLGIAVVGGGMFWQTRKKANI